MNLLKNRDQQHTHITLRFIFVQRYIAISIHCKWIWHSLVCLWKFLILLAKLEGNRTYSFIVFVYLSEYLTVILSERRSSLFVLKVINLIKICRTSCYAFEDTVLKVLSLLKTFWQQDKLLSALTSVPDKWSLMYISIFTVFFYVLWNPRHLWLCDTVSMKNLSSDLCLIVIIFFFSKSTHSSVYHFSQDFHDVMFTTPFNMQVRSKKKMQHADEVQTDREL